MKALYLLTTYLIISLFYFSCNSEKKRKVNNSGIVFTDTIHDELQFHSRNSNVELQLNNYLKKVDVLVDGELFTSLKWDENVFKPVLHPIKTAMGTEITRGFPLTPKPGERADHMNHVGNWFNYGDVNGINFWGNGHSGKRIGNGGEIIHNCIEKLVSGKNEAILITNSKWVDNSENEIIRERTEYHFIAQHTTRIIDRIVTLTAIDQNITFKDTKEGMFAIRVARELEMPIKERTTIVNKNLKLKKYRKTSIKNISGNYWSSEGIQGIKVWGKRAKWMALYGKIGDELITIGICDHPENPNYPTYWHARGYGLFASNPLGVKDFTKNNEELNYSIKAGQSVCFKYRLIIGSKIHFSKSEMNTIADDFYTTY